MTPTQSLTKALKEKSFSEWKRDPNFNGAFVGGPSMGLQVWAAVEPALVRAGVLEMARETTLDRARKQAAGGGR